MVTVVTAKSGSLLREYASKNALNCGWKKINGQWICPHCIKYRDSVDLNKVENNCDY